MQTVLVQTRVDSNLKKNAEEVLSSIGMDMTSAIRLFLTQVVNYRKIPFQLVAKPDERYNAETLAAMQEALDICSGKVKAERYKSFDDIMTSCMAAEGAHKYGE